MAARIALLALVGTLAWAPAWADWEPTRWGMSMAEAMHVLPTASTSTSEGAIGRRNTGGNAGGGYLYVQIDRDGHRYDARLGFVDDKLKSVELTMLNATEARCARARDSMRRHYGEPVNGGEGAGGRYDSWKTDKDAVVLIYRGDPAPRCLVLLSPGDQPKSDAAPGNALLAWLR